VATVPSPTTGNPLLCFHGDCQNLADDAFSTAPVFDEDGTGRRYVHCSWEHMAATMAIHPDFADVQAE